MRDWIPIKEKLPENKDCFYLITREGGNVEGEYCYDDWMNREKGYRFYQWDKTLMETYEPDDVIAWMEYPEPYKEE